jgi:hypothetical protein
MLSKVGRRLGVRAIGAIVPVPAAAALIRCAGRGDSFMLFGGRSGLAGLLARRASSCALLRKCSPATAADVNVIPIDITLVQNASPLVRHPSRRPGELLPPCPREIEFRLAAPLNPYSTPLP